MIKLKNVSKTFKDSLKEVKAVVEVDLQVNNGDVFGIVGSSGAGKSTLIRLLNRLEEVECGEIIVDGVDIVNLTKEELRYFRMQTGMIFQHFNLLWSRTVLENITLPLEITGLSKEQRDNRATELLRIVDLEDKANVYPSELSGGQKQRVGIARAVANNPKILLCDEATSSLDPKTTDTILDLIKTINEKLGITVVLITHEMDVIRKICNRVAVMDHGRVVETGDVIDIFNNPKHDVTKGFVSKEVLFSNDFGERVVPTNKKLLKLFFSNQSAKKSIIRELIVKYDLNPNIIEGQIKAVQNNQIGFLIMEVDSDYNLSQIRKYLTKHNVELEVLLNA